MIKYDDQILSNMTKFMTKLAIQNTKNLQLSFWIGNDPTPLPPSELFRKFIEIGNCPSDECVCVKSVARTNAGENPKLGRIRED